MMVSLRKTPTSVNFEFEGVCHTILGKNFVLRGDANFFVLEIDLSGNLGRRQAGFLRTDTEYLIRESDNLLRMVIADSHLVERMARCQGRNIEVLLRFNEEASLIYKADTSISNDRIMFTVTERK